METIFQCNIFCLTDDSLLQMLKKKSIKWQTDTQ